ncbi:Inherit from KOG: DNA helicase [Seminavis robusta]|uniref:Inherit from KOG: DNA helicase n=1 Tax=Seminavis robusta TaxID=568900 RepID=A0A9N8DJ26_9STRA|nr:Inherit from KOG: DNA helicase [Seminavis robusta]|eukprot:Sro155_g070450.1 Inherit from KOG: DNA helicase (2397) ;mRNA; f:42386-49680
MVRTKVTISVEDRKKRRNERRREARRKWKEARKNWEEARQNWMEAEPTKHKDVVEESIEHRKNRRNEQRREAYRRWKEADPTNHQEVLEKRRIERKEEAQEIAASLLHHMYCSNFNLTPEELKSALHDFSSEAEPNKGQGFLKKEDREAQYFMDRLQNPMKAVLMFYLNSGYFRFEQYRDYTQADDGSPIDLDVVSGDIQAERQSMEELDNMVESFFKCHSYTHFAVAACGSCGVKKIEEPTAEDTGVGEFVVCNLDLPEMSILQYSTEEKQKLQKQMADPKSRVTVPVNERWDVETLEVWKTRSFYEETRPDGNVVFWHLHGELVRDLGTGKKSTKLCPRCWKAIKSGKTPRLSIAAGIDFGLSSRLNLEAPNLHEQLILARTRLFFAMVKVSSNMYGQVNANTALKRRCHAVLFPHDAPDGAAYMFESKLFETGGMLNKAELHKLLHMYMVDPNGRPDSIAREVYETVNLLARPYVIAQWLIVLKYTHCQYSDLDVSSLQDTVDAVILELNEGIMKGAVPIVGGQAVAHEQNLGSDVAQCTTQEVFDAGESSKREQNGTEAATVRGRSNDIQFSFVARDPVSFFAQDRDDIRLKPLERLLNLGNCPKNTDPRGGTAEEEGAVDDGLSFHGEDVDEYLLRFPPAMENTTRRSDDILSDFATDDVGISTSFPHIFMLGVAYKKAPGRLSHDERNHLLNQFHNMPSRDRRLQGYLFDLMMKSKVFDGVKGHVNNSRRAIDTVRKLLHDKKDRSDLKSAIQFPYTKRAKEILNKYLPHFKFASKNISYGALEGSGLKLRMVGCSNRYIAPTCFLTLSPECLGNPRAIRLAYGMRNNYEFPAQFESGCKFGRNGEEFLNSFLEDSSILSEGTITLPRAVRSELATENPVASVQEHRALLYHILNILLKLPIEHEGYYGSMEGLSKRRTRYYKQRKGIFGYSLGACGVTEAHQKGTLHWHITLFAGLSPYVLQRFAHMQKICDEISVALDDMYQSHLPARIHIGGITQRVLSRKGATGEWNIPDKVIQSLKGKEVIAARKHPVDSLKQPFYGCIEGGNFTESFSGEVDGKSMTSLSEPTGVWSSAGSTMSSLKDCKTKPEARVGVVLQAHMPHADGLNALNVNEQKFMGAVRDNKSGFAEEAESHLISLNAVKKSETDSQAMQQQFHSHQKTCRSGTMGKTGCRLCMPVANAESTLPVKLVPMKEGASVEKINNAATEEANENKTLQKGRSNEPMRCWEAVLPDDVFGDEGTPRHHLKDLLSNKLDDHVIVWETRRPVLSSHHFEINPNSTENPRGHIVAAFRCVLGDVESFGGPAEDFWQWMENEAKLDQLMDLYLQVQKDLPAANGFVASFSPILSLCTGSHNNASLLGSLGQAHSAMFYLIPYQGKTKFTLMQSLVLLDKALDHITTPGKESIAPDSGTQARTAKHLLTRVLNRIHLHQELSEYQIAAALLDLPSMIMTDTFAFGSPNSLSALRTHMQLDQNEQNRFDALCDMIAAENMMKNSHNKQHGARAGCGNKKVKEVQQEGSDDSVATEDNSGTCGMVKDPYDPDDVVSSMGYIQRIKLKEGDLRTLDPEYIEFMPASALYLYRGEELAELNYYEYLACVQFWNKKPRNDPSARTFKQQQQFAMDPNFVASPVSYHVLRLKQCVPLLTSTAPPHPGNAPPDYGESEGTPADILWESKANVYAKYFLSLFRPERMQDSHLGYTWKDLKEYITSLQEDSSIISKFRLMSMDNQMKRMRTKTIVKKMTSQYRSRARDLWPPEEETAGWGSRQSLESKFVHTDIEPCDGFELLSAKTNTGMRHQLNHDALQTRHCMEYFGGGAAMKTNRTSGNHRTILSKWHEDELGLVYSNMIEWTDGTYLEARRKRSLIGESDAVVNAPNKRQRQECIKTIRKRVAPIAAGKPSEQEILYDCFSKSLLGKSKPGEAFPQLVLIHGAPGTGKSHLRNALLDASEACDRYNDKTAFNSINAVDMGGTTTCADTGFNPQIHLRKVGTFPDVVLNTARRKLGGREASTAIVHIEEVGTQAPAHLARKDAQCQLLTGCNRSFGGLHTCLYGDLNQLGPVKAGPTLTQAVMDVYACDEIKKRVPRQKKRNQEKATIMPSEDPGQNRYNHNHPYSIGTRLLTQARLFELTEQKRSLDPDHSRLVNKMYRGHSVTQTDIKNHLKLLTPDLKHDPEWMRASILVTTNRERHSLNHVRAEQFAESTNGVVIRWLNDWHNWEQKPPPAFQHEAMQDPCFWEYFVENADGFLNESIQRGLMLVNALPIRYHSIKFDAENETLLRRMLDHSEPGEVIDMPARPLYIIVEVFPPGQTPKAVLDVRFISNYYQGRVTFPAVQGDFQEMVPTGTCICDYSAQIARSNSSAHHNCLVLLQGWELQLHISTVVCSALTCMGW